MGMLDLSLGARIRPGKRAFFVTEQFRGDEIGWDRRAVDRYERALPPSRAGMDGAGCEFLSGPAFPRDQHLLFGAREAPDEFRDLAHGGAFAEDDIRQAGTRRCDGGFGDSQRAFLDGCVQTREQHGIFGGTLEKQTREALDGQPRKVVQRDTNRRCRGIQENHAGSDG
jgi:hypothetical protein